MERMQGVTTTRHETNKSNLKQPRRGPGDLRKGYSDVRPLRKAMHGESKHHISYRGKSLDHTAASLADD